MEEQLKSWDDRSGIEGCLGLDLDPDFQRGHVWTEQKQIEFVEYCLKGGAGSRDIYFNHPGWNTHYKGLMTLVDGKQRLESVRKFLRNELPIFDGHCLNDFDKPKRMLRISDAYLNFHVNNLKTRKELLQWYLEINTGGVVHTDEEINKVRDLLEKEQ
jgi:hypothetical protein